MVHVLPKDSLPAFLSELSGSFSVYAPVERDGLIKFDGYSAGDRIIPDYETTNMPPKFLFIPHGERLLEFGKRGVVVPDAKEKFAVLMNAIDAEAISILDEVFGGKFKDDYYLRRRENSIIIAVQNNVRMLNSFNGELNLKFKGGFDLLLVDSGDCYAVKSSTRKGNQLLKSKYIKDKKISIKDVKNHVKNGMLNLKKISIFLDRGPEQKIWHELASECFACGICAYVCPVCHCFDVEDGIKLEGGGSRLRNWDSCMLADFAAVAGGGNFRAKRHERIHNWYHHKFARAVAERGRPDCVGCGRCITYCPAKIKIHERIKECEK